MREELFQSPDKTKNMSVLLRTKEVGKQEKISIPRWIRGVTSGKKQGDFAVTLAAVFALIHTTALLFSESFFLNLSVSRMRILSETELARLFRRPACADRQVRHEPTHGDSAGKKSLASGLGSWIREAATGLIRTVAEITKKASCVLDSVLEEKSLNLSEEQKKRLRVKFLQKVGRRSRALLRGVLFRRSGRNKEKFWHLELTISYKFLSHSFPSGQSKLVLRVNTRSVSVMKEAMAEHHASMLLMR
ncbi:hypothetical protein M0804_013362 [Polistes exclamans]|nr:hypothetical protein M0804_013362 [Polistes exclamans]